MLAIGLVLILFPGAASSTDPLIVVRNAWIREAPPNATSMAGYMVMENQSDIKQTLLSASAEAFARVMIHRTEHKDGMVHMKHLEEVTIPAQGKVKFEPGSYHLMLANPKQSLRAGDRVTITFIFTKKSQLGVEFEVCNECP